jgi:hypothetical protein
MTRNNYGDGSEQVACERARNGGAVAMLSYHASNLWGLIVLVADIWAIVSIVQSGTTTGAKVLWILLVLFLPVLGFIIWFFAGPKAAR